MDGYLSKPIDSREMLALVETLAAGSATGEAAPVVLPAVPREPAGPKSAAVFDLELALKRCLNKRDLLQQMIAFFFKDVDCLMPQMRTALRKGDLREVGRLGHRLKGTLGHIAAEPAREAARHVEHFLLHAGEQAKAEEAVTALEQECEALKEVLSAHRSTASPAESD